MRLINHKFIAAVSLVVAAIILIAIPRQEPDQFLIQFVQQEYSKQSDWELVNIVDVTKDHNYVKIKVKYRIKKDFTPVENWIIKERTKDHEADGMFMEGEGYIYLMKKGFFSWSVIR